jgi:hypothetical protein
MRKQYYRCQLWSVEDNEWVTYLTLRELPGSVAWAESQEDFGYKTRILYEGRIVYNNPEPLADKP